MITKGPYKVIDDSGTEWTVQHLEHAEAIAANTLPSHFQVLDQEGDIRDDEDFFPVHSVTSHECNEFSKGMDLAAQGKSLTATTTHSPHRIMGAFTYDEVNDVS